MIVQKIHVAAMTVITATTMLMGQTDSASDLNSKNPQCTLSITSPNMNVEIYINKKPGKRTSPDAYTPALITNLGKTKVWLTLFKKGYSDTTLLLDFAPAASKTVDITMVPLKVQALAAQDRFLSDRLFAHVGKYCIISSPLFVAAGAGLLHYSEKYGKKADEARSYLQKTIVQSGPQFDAMQQQYETETRKKKSSFVAGIIMFGLAAIDLGAGIVFYF